MERILDKNWLMSAYYAVSTGGDAWVDPAVQDVFDAHMAGTFDPPSRKGLSQTLKYECRNLAAVAATNVRMHFRARALKHVRTRLAIGDDAYKKLTQDERRSRKLALMQVADDICAAPHETRRSPVSYHAWIDAERRRIGIDAAVQEWDGKPLLCHLEAKPHRFFSVMHTMSTDRSAAGRPAFSLFPLRRSNIPCHARFDKEALLTLLGKKAFCSANSTSANSTGKGKRKRDDPSLVEEKASFFRQVLDLRSVKRRHHFDLSLIHI